MFRSVRFRLVLSFLLVGLAAALAVGMVTLLIANSYFRQQEIDFLTRNADEIASNVRPILEWDDYEGEHKMAPNLWPNLPALMWGGEAQLQAAVQYYSFLGQKRVAVLDHAGRVLADSGAPSPYHVVDLAPAPFSPNHLTVVTSLGGLQVSSNRVYQPFRIQPGQFGWGYVLTNLDDSDALAHRSEPRSTDRPVDAPNLSDLVVRVPVWSGGEEEIGYIQLSEGPSYGRPILKGIRQALIGGVLAAVLLAIVVGFLSARQLTRPLTALGAAAEKMAAGDLSARAPNHRRDEFGQLARQFNRMADQLQATVERLAADREALRRFIADASHELRSPLTALKTFNAIWSSKPGLKGRPESDMLQANAEQIERLDSLTRGLLDLSRLDADLPPDEIVREDIRPLMERVEAEFRPLVEAKQLDMTLELPEAPAVLLHDPAFLRRAVDNMLRNALKFTPAGGRVSVGVEQDQDEIRVWVDDSGPGIPSDEMPYIFDRFYRGSNAAGIEGSGLGLAIVQAVARAHHGRVTVDCSSGCCFTLHLPRVE